MAINRRTFVKLLGLAPLLGAGTADAATHKPIEDEMPAAVAGLEWWLKEYGYRVEKRHEYVAKWPESFVIGVLPWDHGQALLELLDTTLDEYLCIEVLWAHRIKLAAPRAQVPPSLAIRCPATPALE